MANVNRCEEATLLKGEAKYTSDGKDTAKRVFYVMFETAPANPDDAVDSFLNHQGLSMDEPLYTGDSRLLKEITPACLATTCDYVFTLDYAVPDDGSFATLDPNPLMRPDELTLTGSVASRTYFQDYSDTQMQMYNTAGELFENLPERDVGSFELSIRGNRASMDAATWATYLYPVCAVNSDNVTIRGLSFGPGQLKMKPFKSTVVTEGTLRYLQVDFGVACAENWDQKFESRGWVEKRADGKQYAIKLADGYTTPSMPYPLNENGTRKTNATDAPYVQTFKPYPKKPFGIFGWTAAS